MGLWLIFCFFAAITDDLASIKYRNEEELLNQSQDAEKMYRDVILPDKLRLCLKYKKMIGFKTDLKIIFATLGRVLKNNPQISQINAD